jgi:hypothetical protein
MAGRGTDILLGGNPAGLASEILHKQGLNPAEVDKPTYDQAFAEAKAITDDGHEKVVAAGGLHIIGTERHDSRRIDNQLRGRAGRQGDPGSSRFYLSLEDDLMKRFASDRVAGLMERLGLEDDVAIESGLVGKTIESAQSRVEGFNFDMRKRVVEYDDVINRQRETIYDERNKVLRNEDLSDTVRAFLEDEIESSSTATWPARASTTGGWRASPPQSRQMGLGDEPGASEDDLWELGGREEVRSTSWTSPTRSSRRRRRRSARRTGRRSNGSSCSGRSTPVGRAPDRGRRHAAGHRAPRLRPAGPAQRVPPRGLPALRGAERPHTATSRLLDLPRHRDPPAPGAHADDFRRERPARGRSGGTRGRGRGLGIRRRRGRHGNVRKRRRPPRASDPVGRSRPPVAALAADPMARAMRESTNGSPSSPGGSSRASPERRPDRAQRPVLLRVRAEVQEMSRVAEGKQGETLGPRPRVLKDLTRLALAVVAGALLVLAYTTWRIWDQGNQDDPRPADAIVVLGAAQYNGVPSPIYRARLDHAIDLFEDGSLRPWS